MICGWISPEGKVYSCAYMEHLDLAYELCAQIQIPCGTVPDEELVKYGWIKAYFSIFDPKFICILTIELQRPRKQFCGKILKIIPKIGINWEYMNWNG